MDPHLRSLYNQAYSPALYRRYIDRLETYLGVKIPFPVAETPLFIPAALRDRLARAANEIVEQISEPALIEKMKQAIPKHLDVPRMDHLPGCVQVDFAICRDEAGELDCKVVELQAFPSLYGMMVVQADAMSAELQAFPGLDRKWSIFYSGLDRESFLARFRHALLAGHEPEEVVLLDLEPEQQKTYPDFVATKFFTGVDSISPLDLQCEGLRLYREVDGRKVQVKRIFNRIVFDELFNKKAQLPFEWTDDLDVSWVCHPNWYWVWSKYTLPHLNHPAVPKATLLTEMPEIPADLSRYVLKPLFSFAGAGVKVDPTHEDIAAIPAAERSNWMLMEKIEYAPALLTPEGAGVKAEVRMMFLRAPDEAKPTLVLNLVRLSRGKMLGVDQNKGFNWVGGSIGIWPVD
jgi:hypothetical protein